MSKPISLRVYNGNVIWLGDKFCPWVSPEEVHCGIWCPLFMLQTADHERTEDPKLGRIASVHCGGDVVVFDVSYKEEVEEKLHAKEGAS